MSLKHGKRSVKKQLYLPLNMLKLHSETVLAVCGHSTCTAQNPPFSLTQQLCHTMCNPWYILCATLTVNQHGIYILYIDIYYSTFINIKMINVFPSQHKLCLLRLNYKGQMFIICLYLFFNWPDWATWFFKSKMFWITWIAIVTYKY